MALPGVQTTLKDRFYTLSRTDIPIGPRVLGIARRTTSDGTNGVADYDPYEATDEAQVIASFGDGSELHRCYVELAMGGAARVFLVALPKGTTDANIASTSAVTIAGNGVDHSHGSHVVLDKAFEAAEIARPDIVVPWGRGGHPDDWNFPATPGNQVDLGIYADNSNSITTSLAVRVANYCMDISQRSHPTLGVMGVKPYLTEFAATPANTVSTGNVTASQLTTHFTFPGLVDRELDAFATGMYVSVVVVEMRPAGYPVAWGYTNGAAHYAASLSQMASYTALTGKRVFNVSSLRYNTTRTMQQNIIDKGLVPVTLDYQRYPTWVDAQTFAPATSDYTRLTTIRIIFDAILMVRQICQQYVGEATTLENRNALDTAISSGLRQMQIAGALLASDKNVEYLPRENKAIVNLVLTPAFELRTIEISVSVQL